VARVSPALARAIDRLSRRAHRFHRFAHHPLCPQYAGELVRLGRRGRLCRGCLYAALGCFAGAAAGLSAPIAGAAHLLTGLGLAASVAAVAALAPAGERASKLGTRCAPLAGVSFLFFAGVRLGGALGAASALVAACTVAATYVLYRRRGPDRSPCATCPERSQPQVCRGFAPIVRRERALQRVARRWLAATGH
jgi:hypothetical protein